MRSDPLVSTRYDLPTIWFHWAVAILVLIQWGIAQVIDLFPAGMPRVEARSVHISLGLCLGVLLAVRILGGQHGDADFLRPIKACYRPWRKQCIMRSTLF